MIVRHGVRISSGRVKWDPLNTQLISYVAPDGEEAAEDKTLILRSARILHIGQVLVPAVEGVDVGIVIGLVKPDQLIVVDPDERRHVVVCGRNE